MHWSARMTALCVAIGSVATCVFAALFVFAYSVGYVQGWQDIRERPDLSAQHFENKSGR